MGKREIIQAIRQIAGVNPDQAALVAAEVISVDESARTCIIQTVGGQDSIQIENVRLMASVDDGMLLIPSVESTVLVSYSTYNQPYISLFSRLDKVLFIVGESIVEIVDGEIKFNDGSFGGLVKVIELTEKLNNLENKVNTLINTFNTHVHSGVTTGGGSSAVTPTPVSGTLTPTQRIDIENELVTHGQS